MKSPQEYHKELNNDLVDYLVENLALESPMCVKPNYQNGQIQCYGHEPHSTYLGWFDVGTDEDIYKEMS